MIQKIGDSLSQGEGWPQHAGPVHYGNYIWVVLSDDTYNTLKVMRSSDAITWTEQDAGNGPTDVLKYEVHQASNLLYVGYIQHGTTKLTVRHFDMDVVAWGASADATDGPAVADIGGADVLGFYRLSNGTFRFIHNAYSDDFYREAVYSDYAGASWDSNNPILLYPATANECLVLSSCIDANDRIYVFAYSLGDAAFYYRSIALDGTLDTIQTVVAAASNADYSVQPIAAVIEDEVMLGYHRSGASPAVYVLRADVGADPVFTDSQVRSGDVYNYSTIAVGQDGTTPYLLWTPTYTPYDACKVSANRYESGAWQADQALIDIEADGTAPGPMRPGVVASQLAMVLTEWWSPIEAWYYGEAPAISASRYRGR